MPVQEPTLLHVPSVPPLSYTAVDSFLYLEVVDL